MLYDNFFPFNSKLLSLYLKLGEHERNRKMKIPIQQFEACHGDDL